MISEKMQNHLTCSFIQYSLHSKCHIIHYMWKEKAKMSAFKQFLIICHTFKYILPPK